MDNGEPMTANGRHFLNFALGMLLSILAGVVLWAYENRFIRFVDSAHQISNQFAVVTWGDLREFDYQNNQLSPKLESLSGKKVRIPGFVVPLGAPGTQEFLLVPSPQACIHVPPPPPNQMVYVQMEGSSTAPERRNGPVWVMGTFVPEASDSQYGEVSFRLTGRRHTPYTKENAIKRPAG